MISVLGFLGELLGFILWLAFFLLGPIAISVGAFLLFTNLISVVLCIIIVVFIAQFIGTSQSPQPVAYAVPYPVSVSVSSV